MRKMSLAAADGNAASVVVDIVVSADKELPRDEERRKDYEEMR